MRELPCRLAIAALLAMPLGAATALQITSTQALGFGAIVAGSAGGTVAVSPLGMVQCGGDLTCLSQSNASPARFQMTGGAPAAMFSISLPLSILLTSPTGETLTVDDFADSLGGSGQFNSMGNASFTVGATLHVGPAQPATPYSGSFTVTVNYQ